MNDINNLENFNNNYSNESMNKLAKLYRNIVKGVNFDRQNKGGRIIEISRNLVEEIRNYRNNYCKMDILSNTCNKKEVGGILTGDKNNKGTISIYSRIEKLVKGDGDTIQLDHKTDKDLIFHTHPNAFGIWNKASPPSEFDLYSSLVYAVNGENLVNLVWDSYGIYIYYLLPKVALELRGNQSILENREEIINILRYTKMGFGFYWKGKDYKGHYKVTDNSFSKYRNLLKSIGFYVNFKPYKSKKIEFIIPV